MDCRDGQELQNPTPEVQNPTAAVPSPQDSQQEGGHDTAVNSDSLSEDAGMFLKPHNASGTGGSYDIVVPPKLLKSTDIPAMTLSDNYNAKRDTDDKRNDQTQKTQLFMQRNND